MEKPEQNWFTEARVAWAVFFGALFVYLSNATLLAPEPDTVPNAYVSASVLGDGDLAFSPFEAPFMFVWTAKGRDGGDVRLHVAYWTQVPPGSLKSYAQHYDEGRLQFAGPMYYLAPTTQERPRTGEPLFASTFGPAAGLTVLPLAALAKAVGISQWEDPAAAWVLAKLTAALLIAGSVALVYLSALAFAPRPRALLVALGYGFGTCVWSISSQALWQQTPEIFFISLGLFALLRLKLAWLRGLAAGLAFSAAFACRPTAALVGMTAFAWLALADRRAALPFVLSGLPLVAALLAFNYHYFGMPLDFGQLVAGARVAQFKTGSADVWQTAPWIGAAGLLASPSRGLLIYSPFIAAAFAGAVIAWRDERYRALRWMTVGVLALWAPAFAWFDWWGGWSYGYRPIVDSMPLLALLCVPAFEALLKRRVWHVALVGTLAWSVFVQGLGVFVYSPWAWNSKPIDAAGTRANVDLPEFRHRLWSFTDWQIGYLIANWQQARAERTTPVAY